VENPTLNWITGLIRLASWVVCLIVVAAFILFATHSADGATAGEVAQLGNSAPLTKTAADKPSSVRQTITNASNTLTSPFTNVFNTTNTWGIHASQLVIALLLYGFGVSYAVRWIRLRRE